MAKPVILVSDPEVLWAIKDDAQLRLKIASGYCKDSSDANCLGGRFLETAEGVQRVHDTL